ncbi:MAG: hypothetical protein PF488_00915 [Patescibacteria group bacterium]|jgi:hypothetical protein|nr:hypothetical protein [Patescibacteria group bacterium]
MKSIKISYIIAITIILFTGLSPLNAKAEFDPNRIIEDNFFFNTNSMTISEIQSFLEEKNSFLAGYVIKNAYGTSKTAAQIIWDAANNNYDCDGVELRDHPSEAERMVKCKKITTINPQFLLILLQKEQSLITKASPSQKTLDEATGYGCPTGGYCSPYWKGFGKQVNSASLQFKAYYNSPANYRFRNGGTYIAKDKYSMLKTIAQAIQDGSYNEIADSPEFTTITIKNKATAALYNYTPHVYNGNYNVYKLLNNYFPEVVNGNSNFPTTNEPVRDLRSFPNGTLIKAETQPEIWLIDNGQKRHFANWSTFATRFSLDQVITATEAEIEKYSKGPAIKFPNYSLVKTDKENIYLLVDDKKRPFASEEVYKNFGFHPSELESAKETDLLSYDMGKEITFNSTYLTGIIVEEVETGKYFYLEDDTKAPIDKLVIETRYKNQSISKKSQAELNKLEKVDPILFKDSTLVRTSNYPTIYLISDEKKRPFASKAVFNKLGYSEDNVITASSQVLYYYDKGEIIK